ncbi:hypothetical protein [Dactylosporangium sp. NPDC051541]|uniref:hypothetical protein n=1 Tax=Dactylosporangium sp. NPDC051541 TaxID=3363977 RepID=UPI003789AB17
MRGQMSLFGKSETATMRDRTRSRKYSPMVEAFRRVHREQRDWGLEQRHAAKLRRIYGDNVPVTKEEWLQARAARLAQAVEAQAVEAQAVEAQAVKPSEQAVEAMVVEAQEQGEVLMPAPTLDVDVVADACAAEPEFVERTGPVRHGPLRSARPVVRRVSRSWAVRCGRCRLEGHRVVGSADGNYRIAWSGP